MNNCISETLIAKHLNRSAAVEVYDVLPSTNTYAAQNLLWNNETRVIVAKQQTAGKGRLGRQFYSPGETGLYMSVVIYPHFRGNDLLLVTPAAAIAVCEAIERFTEQKPTVKWVNDIIVDGKKVCGILTQSVQRGDETAVIVGIGVNISTADFPQDILSTAGSLGCESIDINSFAASIVSRLCALVDTVPGEIAHLYRLRLSTLGCKVDYEQNGERHTATAVDIDEYCGLVVEDEQGNCSVIKCGEATMHRVE